MEFLNALISAPSWISIEVRRVLDPLLLILMVVLSIVTIIIILMQKSVASNAGAVTGDSETYIGKNKGQNKERTLKILTIVMGGLLLIVSILYFLFQIK